MILKDKTIKELGIDIENISEKSHKKIFVMCDYCQSEYLCQVKNRTTSYKKFPKDACNNCRYKKREDISLKNYGVKNSTQRADVKDKISERNRCWLNSDEFKDKRSKTMLKKYGTDNPMQSQQLRDKHKRAIKEKYGVDNIMKIDGIARRASEKAVQTKINNGTIKSVDGLTLPQKAREIGLSRSFFGKLVTNLGIEEALSYEKQYSSLENSIFDFLTLKGFSPCRDVVLGAKKPDIVVDNVVIECDGLYWHCDEKISNKSYHKEKMLIYKSAGYKPLFFRGDEIIDKFDIVCSIIMNALHSSKTLYARNTFVKEITNLEAYDFCETNHLMGGFKSASVSLALIFNKKIVSVFQVKELKKNSKSYDLSRYCTLNNFGVTGGFSKLLKYFELKFQPEALQTFIDLRYGSGDYLTNFGFNQSFCDLSFRWTDGVNTFHRMKFPGNSGYKHGLNKIWDCGQRKMVKTY